MAELCQAPLDCRAFPVRTLSIDCGRKGVFSIRASHSSAHSAPIWLQLARSTALLSEDSPVGNLVRDGDSGDVDLDYACELLISIFLPVPFGVEYIIAPSTSPTAKPYVIEGASLPDLDYRPIISHGVCV